MNGDAQPAAKLVEQAAAGQACQQSSGITKSAPVVHTSTTNYPLSEPETEMRVGH